MASGDTLRAKGGFSVKQTDFGIQPFRGGPGGTVKVADLGLAKVLENSEASHTGQYLKSVLP